MRANKIYVWLQVWAVCMLLTFSVVAVAKTGSITSVKVDKISSGVLITVAGDGPLTVGPFRAPAGKYLGFDFKNAIAVRSGGLSVKFGKITSVKWGRFRSRPPVSRIVINTVSQIEYSTAWSEDRSRMVITCWNKAPGKSDVAASAADLPKEPEQDEVVVERIAPAVDTTGEIADMPNPAQEPIVTKPSVVAKAPRVRTEKKAPPVAVVEPKPAKTPATPETRPIAEKLISLNLRGADINDVLQAIAAQSGSNIVASKDVTGEITLNLTGVTVTEALDYVTKVSGFVYTQQNGTYLVGTKESVKAIVGSDGAEGSAVEYVWLQYAAAASMKDLLATQFPRLQVFLFGQTAAATPAKSGEESSTTATTAFGANDWMREVPPSSDMLALSGPRDQVAAAKVVIAQVEDSIKNQKEAARQWIDGKKRVTYKAKYVDAKELSNTVMALIPGVAVAFAPSEGFRLVDLGKIALEESGSTVVRADAKTGSSGGDSSGGGKAEAQIASQSPTGGGSLTGQTTSRTLVMVGRDADIDKAVKLCEEMDVKTPQIKIDAKITSITKSAEDKLGLKWDWDGLTYNESPERKWIRDPVGFASTLDALATNGDVDILAAPSLTCLEGKMGVFFVGDEITYIVRVETTPTGQNVQTDKKLVGVQIRVAGEVSPDGYITLILHPEVSILKLEASAAAGITLPIVARRFTDHTIRVKSGETFVIGGLIRNDEITDMTKVPLLGDIPFFGKLFQHMSKTKDRTEVVMFITASVVPE